MMTTREHNAIWNCMVIWEAMLDWNNADNAQLQKGGPRTPFLDLWENRGTNEMRDMAMDLEPWVQGVFDQLETILGDDPLETLDIVPFDWEFVPCLLKVFVTWNKNFGPSTPPVDETAARIIAMQAHGIELHVQA